MASQPRPRWKVMWGARSFAREQATKCERLAANCADPLTRERFLTLARDYLARADAEERDQTDR